jgi:hypothetical protein
MQYSLCERLSSHFKMFPTQTAVVREGTIPSFWDGASMVAGRPNSNCGKRATLSAEFDVSDNRASAGRTYFAIATIKQRLGSAFSKMFCSIRLENLTICEVS